MTACWSVCMLFVESSLSATLKMTVSAGVDRIVCLHQMCRAVTEVNSVDR